MRSRAGLRGIRCQADGGHCPCPRWSCTAFRLASEGRYRPYPPSDQRVRHRRRWLPSMPLCHTTAKATAQTLRQLLQERLGFPGAIGIGKGIRFQMGIMRLMQSADISELAEGVPGPLLTDAHRRGTVPVLCPLWGCGRIVTAWQRHGRSGCSGRLSG